MASAHQNSAADTVSFSAQKKNGANLPFKKEQSAGIRDISHKSVPMDIPDGQMDVADSEVICRFSRGSCRGIALDKVWPVPRGCDKIQGNSA